VPAVPAKPAVAPARAPARAPAPADRPPQRPRRVAAWKVHRGARAHIRDLYEKGGLAVLLAQWLKDLPAWLVSLVVHVVLILLLGMWFTDDKGQERITLATVEGDYDLAGGVDDPVEQFDVEAVDFQTPGAVEWLGPVDQIGVPEQPDIEVDSPVVQPHEVDPIGNLPDSAFHSAMEVPRAPIGKMFQGRDPKARRAILSRAGGTTQTEAAVARGLKWLARHQHEDGHWSFHEFHKAPGAAWKKSKRGRIGLGGSRSDTAATALALLPFLGANQTHEQGEYTDEVFRGLRWLVEQQKEDGDLRGPGDGRMYAHAQAAIALCEAYAMTGDEQLHEPAQQALNFIVKAQARGGGWRYEPGQPGDTSVVGWQLMALQVGKEAGNLHVPQRTLERAGSFLDRVKRDQLGGRYSYQPGGGPTDAMTAEALLCRRYLGWGKDHPGMVDGVKFLLEEHPPDAKRPNIYYWYYATQVMRHFGGPRWEKWNEKMRSAVLSLQEQHGPGAGSWAPQGRDQSGGFANRGGRVYMTALAVCILEVYYRHAPLDSDEIIPAQP